MERTSTRVETCPACGGLDIRVTALGWIASTVERAAGLRAPRPDFRCRDCNWRWD